jgi:multidrug efflux pump subunit AcrB
VNFSSLSIKHPVPAIMLFALLTLAGILSYPLQRGAGLP